MRLLHVLSIVGALAAVWLGMSAWDAYEAVGLVRANNDAIRAELQTLSAEVAVMEKVEASPLRFTDDAMAAFFSRTVEAGEVLGAGVRVEPRDVNLGSQSMSFVEFRHGVLLSQVTLQAAMEGDSAPAILSMFEEELADLPVAVRKLTARKVGRDVAVTMDVDVFGRTP